MENSGAEGAKRAAGVDVGGTFTDLVLVDGGGHVRLAKVPTGAVDPAQGVLHALEASGAPLAALDWVVHGTTAATNAVLTRKLARTGLITTRGFRDVLELGRRTRPHAYGMMGGFRPVIPRDLRLEVDERMEASGRVRAPLDDKGVRDAVRRLLDLGCESLVIHFLHAYANPAHERRAAAIAAETWPNPFITTGHSLLSEAREFERGVTAAVNGAVRPIMERYLQRLSAELSARGFKRDLLVMNGNGGTVSARAVGAEAAKTVMSGPASGVIAAASIARTAGFSNLVTYDMGGTSTDVALVVNGQAGTSDEIELEYAMPIHLPMVAVHSVGAGGGSIAKLNAAGLLEVGPESAGARPGPIAFGRGGTEPTLTDANLLLGRLDPEKLLSVQGRADVHAVRKAFAAKIGGRIGLDGIQAAAAVLRLGNLKMANAVRSVSVARGHDPRDFVLFAFGGAGPLHACAVARDLGLPTVLVPARPGLTNALGCVLADFRQDFSNTLNQPVATLDEAEARGVLARHRAEGARLMAAEGLGTQALSFSHCADMQFAGQTHLVTVPLPSPELSRAALQALFEEAYFRRFKVRLPEIRAVLVNLKTTVTGARPPPDLSGLLDANARASSLERARTGSRLAWFGAGFRPTTVYARERLPIGARIPGPAVIEQMDATTAIEIGDLAEVDSWGNLVITVGKDA
ncbi:MAG TPA: hydantoinase/oxoprolinase family protein [Mesorhizobium sp.]|jgi:N-methylhydantoinase A|nr:hydantoinase/oxoprolinase family protein [Mesorhizobium sp.]